MFNKKKFLLSAVVGIMTLLAMGWYVNTYVYQFLAAYPKVAVVVKPYQLPVTTAAPTAITGIEMNKEFDLRVTVSNQSIDALDLYLSYDKTKVQYLDKYTFTPVGYFTEAIPVTKSVVNGKEELHLVLVSLTEARQKLVTVNLRFKSLATPSNVLFTLESKSKITGVDTANTSTYFDKDPEIPTGAITIVSPPSIIPTKTNTPIPSNTKPPTPTITKGPTATVTKVPTATLTKVPTATITKAPTPTNKPTSTPIPGTWTIRTRSICPDGRVASDINPKYISTWKWGLVNTGTNQPITVTGAKTGLYQLTVKDNYSTRELRVQAPVPTGFASIESNLVLAWNGAQLPYGSYTVNFLTEAAACPAPTIVATRPPVGSPTLVTPNICPLKSKGDADCDGIIHLKDAICWVLEAQNKKPANCKSADFNGNGKVGTSDLVEFGIWRNSYIKANTIKVVGDTPTSGNGTTN